MSNSTRGLIESYSISNNFSEDQKYFKQISLMKIFTIDDNNPNIGNLVKVKVYADIEDSKVLKTISGSSKDGQIFTGSELLAYGVVEGNLYYASDNIYKSINSYQFTINFSSYIVMKAGCQSSCSPIVSAVVKDIYIDRIDERSLFCIISLILCAK